MRGESIKVINKYCLRNNSALMIVDMQEAFVGNDSRIPVPRREAVINANLKVVEIFRRQKIPMIWTQIYLDKWTNSVYSELWPEHFEKQKAIVLSTKNSDYEIVGELKKVISPDDLVISKHRYSAFYNPLLHRWLKRKKIENIFFSGVTTNVCVESTIRDAFQLGFRPFLISDATGTFRSEYQEVSEAIISMVFGHVIKIRDLEELMCNWNSPS